MPTVVTSITHEHIEQFWQTCSSGSPSHRGQAALYIQVDCTLNVHGATVTTLGRAVGVCNCVKRGLPEPRAGSVLRVRSRNSNGNSALVRSHWTKTHPSHDLARQR